MAERFGPPLPLQQKPLRTKMVGHKGPLRFALRMGEVQRVDYERMVCDIAWLQGSSPAAREVPITGPYWSKRGFLGAMPDVGAIAVCGFSASHEDQGVKPFILTFLPNGYMTGMNFDVFGVAERNAQELNVPVADVQKELDGIYGPTRHRFRKIYPGDIYASSDKGSELILDHDVRLLSAQGSEVWLRAEDQAWIVTALDAYTTTAATRHRSGRVVRGALTPPPALLGPQGPLAPGSLLFENLVDAGVLYADGTPTPTPFDKGLAPLASGHGLAVVTHGGQDPLGPTTRALTEDRLEIQEFSDQNLPFPDHYGFDADQIGDVSHWTPFIERVYGTVVGNDPYSVSGRSGYGRPQKPVIFADAHATSAQPGLQDAGGERALEGAFLYRMRRPDGLGDLFVSHDKEGHVFLSIPASTSQSSNLGAGRSVEADIKGGIKAVIGANQNDNASVDTYAKGGVKWTLGALANGRSLDVLAKGGLHFRVDGKDAAGYGWRAAIAGDVGVAVDGNQGVSVSGELIETVGTKRKMSADSIEVSVGLGDLNETVLSDYNRTVTGAESKRIGAGRTATIVAPRGGTDADSLTILAGSRQTAFGAPASDRIQFATAGTVSVAASAALGASWQSGGAGTFAFTAPAGSYAVRMGAGTVSLQGAVVDVTAAATVTVAAPSIHLTGSVGLGKGASAALAVVGGLPGPSPYIDPLTGTPLTGNPLVRTA